MVTNVHSPTPQLPEKTRNPDRLIRWPEVQAIVGICRSHAHQLAAKHLFPKPIKLVPGGRASAWSEAAILGWVEQRKADSTADVA